MDTLVSLVWVIAATVVAVPLVLDGRVAVCPRRLSRAGHADGETTSGGG